MSRRAYPRRYTEAIFDIALQANELDRWQSDLQTITTLVGDAEIEAFLESPRLSFKDKTRLLSECFKGINPLALNLIMLLVNRGRLNLIAEIAEEYYRRLDNYRGVEHADVTTAVAMDRDEAEKLAARLGKLTGKKVLIEPKVNPEIIGGVVVRVGEKLLDGSTRAKLEALKKELVGRA